MIIRLGGLVREGLVLGQPSKSEEPRRVAS